MAMDLPLVLATMPAYMEQAHLLWKWDFEPAYANHMKVLKLLAHQQGSEDNRYNKRWKWKNEKKIEPHKGHLIVELVHIRN